MSLAATAHSPRTPRPSRLFALPLSSDYSGSDGDYFYKMNVCGPANAGGPCGNALVCQYNAKTTNFVAKIAVYDGYFGPRLTLLDGNNPGAGVQAHYLNGDICFLGPTKKRNPRTTIVSSFAAHSSDAMQCRVRQDTSERKGAGGCTADSLRCTSLALGLPLPLCSCLSFVSRSNTCAPLTPPTRLTFTRIATPAPSPSRCRRRRRAGRPEAQREESPTEPRSSSCQQHPAAAPSRHPGWRPYACPAD